MRVERAALSVERVLMALAQKARPRLKPHHPSRLPTEAPAPGHQCAAPVGEKEGAPWSSALPHPRRSTGSRSVLPVLFPLSLSIKRARRLPLQALCLATDLLIRAPTSGLGSHRFGTSA